MGMSNEPAKQLVVVEGDAINFNRRSEKVQLFGEDGKPFEFEGGGSGPAENGLPSGGTEDQVLAKNSSTDYDTKWVDAHEGGKSGYYQEVYAVQAYIDYVSDSDILNILPQAGDGTYIYAGEFENEDPSGLYMVQSGAIVPVLVGELEQDTTFYIRYRGDTTTDALTDPLYYGEFYVMRAGTQTADIMSPVSETLWITTDKIRAGDASISIPAGFPGINDYAEPSLGHEITKDTDLASLLRILASGLIPRPDESGTFVLKADDGVVFWSAE